MEERLLTVYCKMAQSLNTTFIVEEGRNRDSVFSKDSLTVSDSTRSLLTPLYASDYENDSRLLFSNLLICCTYN